MIIIFDFSTMPVDKPKYKRARRFLGTSERARKYQNTVLNSQSILTDIGFDIPPALIAARYGISKSIISRIKRRYFPDKMRTYKKKEKMEKKG